jgi:hypothetical protein
VGSPLGPDCDPDLSRGPAWAVPAQRPATPGVRSTLLLLAVLAATAFLALGGVAPLWLAICSGVVALLTARALARRAVRVARGARRGLRTA